MANDIEATPPAQERATAGTHKHRTAMWLGSVSILLSVALSALIVIPWGVSIPSLLLVIAAAAGVTGLVLAVRARRRGGAAGRALTLGVVGLMLNAALIAIIAVPVLAQPRFTQVEVRAQGGPGLTATFADDTQSYTEAWPQNGWKQFTTEKSSAQISVTSPQDSTQLSVSCQILWDGEVVAEESSETGTVTCFYSED